MKDRIKQFIDHKGISPGDLASALDVQRSNISHILNGRNKPGAAFIEKILLVYPDLNARWLLTGLGDMVNSENANITDISNNTTQERHLEDKKKLTVTKELKEKDNTTHSRQIVINNELDRVVLLFSDGTFKTYNPK